MVYIIINRNKRDSFSIHEAEYCLDLFFKWLITIGNDEPLNEV